MRLTILLVTLTTIAAAWSSLRLPAIAPTAAPAAPAAAVSQPPERAVVGTLEQVNAAATQIVVKTPAGRQTFELEAGATVRQGTRTIKPSELGSHKGERLKVRYRDVSGTHRAAWIVIAPPVPRKGKGV